MIQELDRQDLHELRILKKDGFYGVTLPVNFVLQGTSARTAANYTTPFFIANRSYSVISVIERHEVADATNTVMLKRVPSGTAPASGSDLLSAAIDLGTTANTNQTASLIYTPVLTTGDSLACVSSGALANIQGLTISILLKAI